VSASWSFRLLRVRDLTARRIAGEIIEQAGKQASKPLLVHFERASAAALQIMRERQISFVGENGGCFLFSPPLIVDRTLPPSPNRQATLELPAGEETRNPFGRMGSRVLRYLLLHPDESFTMHELAKRTNVSPTLVTRVTHVLDAEAWIDLDHDLADRRIRRVRIRRPREALLAWGRAWDRRRIPIASWNIRSDGVEAVMRRLKRVKSQVPQLRWALGGLAGASLVRRVVEPMTTLLWVPRQDLVGLEDSLSPTRSGRASPQLRVAIAPDDFIFHLATEKDGVRIADPVQLWLDCYGEGERALEAADAIAEKMGW
jgi:DNA-binding MarR family transcriptional regulator